MQSVKKRIVIMVTAIIAVITIGYLMIIKIVIVPEQIQVLLEEKNIKTKVFENNIAKLEQSVQNKEDFDNWYTEKYFEIQELKKQAAELEYLDKQINELQKQGIEIKRK